MLSTVAPGSSTASQYYTAGTFGANAQFMTFVPPSLPVITAPTAVNSANGTTATLGANVTSPGTAIVAPTIQTRGVVYAQTSTNSNPTVGGTGVTQVASTAATGTFTVSASLLSQGTQYSYAAYVSTYYGLVYTVVDTFVTPTLPTVTSPTATNITGVSATLGGNVTSNGGGTLTARGIVYSAIATSNNPVIGATGVTNVTDATAATSVFTDGTGNNLANGTGYAYKAYATNGVGTAYTAVGTFTTAAKPTAMAQSLHANFNTAAPATLTGTDPNSPAQTLTYTVATAPTQGTLSGTAPNLTYTPTANYAGSDSFTFRVSNGTNPSNPATVTINVAGIASAITSATGVVFTDGRTNTFTVTTTGTPNAALTESGTLPANVTFTDNGNGTATLSGTPAAGATGSYPLTITANNGVNPTATQSFTLTLNRPPSAGLINLGANQNTPAQVSAARLLASASDADGDALTITSAGPLSNQGNTVSLSAPGNVGIVTYTPAASFTGSDTFSYVVSDGRGGTTSGTVSVTVYAAGKYVLGTQSVSRTASTVTIVYTGIPSDTYQPQYTSNLVNGSWINDSPVLTAASNGQFTYMDATQPQPPQRFYRVIASL